MTRPIPHVLRYWYIERINTKIFLDYQPKAYANEIVLFRGDVEENGVFSDPLRGWARIASGGIEVIEISGAHHNSLVEEKTLGEQLVLQLRKAQKQ